MTVPLHDECDEPSWRSDGNPADWAKCLLHGTASCYICSTTVELHITVAEGRDVGPRVEKATAVLKYLTSGPLSSFGRPIPSKVALGEKDHSNTAAGLIAYAAYYTGNDPSSSRLGLVPLPVKAPIVVTNRR